MLKTTKSIAVFSVFMFFLSCNKNETKEIETENSAPKIEQNSAEKDSIKSENSATSTSYKKFEGAWFDVEYPSDFVAKGSMKSLTNVDGYDTAFFTSPDGKVQFYIFSPQWIGKPNDIEVKPSEMQGNTTIEKKDKNSIKRWTIMAKDKSYNRSYEEVTNTELNVNRIFGIKYASTADLTKYKDEYLHFKNSLIQYAD